MTPYHHFVAELARLVRLVIARLLGEHRPATIFFPHDADWNSSHIGTHHLLVDALTRQAPAFICRVVETEFWGAMATPNLMVESSIDDVAEMMTALSFHVGEVRRNAVPAARVAGRRAALRARWRAGPARLSQRPRNPGGRHTSGLTPLSIAARWSRGHERLTKIG